MSSVKLDPHMAMFKGEVGTRKSTSALSYPTPQYWFNSDRKMAALIKPMKDWGIKPEDINYDDYSNWMSAEQKLKSLKESCKFKTIIFDSITTSADNINLQTRSLKSGTTAKSGDEKGHRVGGIAVNTLEDYKAEASAFQEMIDKLLDIKKYHNAYIILIAHVIGERSNEVISTYARIIATGGKVISAKIPAYCQEIYHFEVKGAIDSTKGEEYAILTTHTGNDYARTSLPLERKIIFNNQPLYQTYIKPAIDKLNNK